MFFHRFSYDFETRFRVLDRDLFDPPVVERMKTSFACAKMLVRLTYQNAEKLASDVKEKDWLSISI